MTIAAGCVREPNDPKELIPTNSFLESEDYGFKLIVPATMKVKEQGEGSWALAYSGLESRPMVEIEATRSRWDPPSDWRDVATVQVGEREGVVYETPEGETKTVVYGVTTLIVTGKNRTVDRVLDTIVYE